MVLPLPCFHSLHCSRSGGVGVAAVVLQPAEGAGAAGREQPQEAGAHGHAAQARRGAAPQARPVHGLVSESVLARPLIWQQGAIARVEKCFYPSLLLTFWGQVFLPRKQEGRKEALLLFPCSQNRALVLGRRGGSKWVIGEP